MSIRRAHLVAAAFSIFCSCLIIFFSIPLYEAGFGGGGAPGPGVFPFWIGLLTTCFGGVYFWQSIKNTNQGKFLPDDRQQRNGLFQTAIAIVAYVSLMPFLGFLLASFLILVGYLKWIGGYRLRFILPFSVGVTIFLYYCFNVLLYISLPKGFIDW